MLMLCFSAIQAKIGTSRTFQSIRKKNKYNAVCLVEFVLDFAPSLRNTIHLVSTLDHFAIHLVMIAFRMW